MCGDWFCVQHNGSVVVAGASVVDGAGLLIDVPDVGLLPVSEDDLSAVDLVLDVRLPPKLDSEATAVIVSIDMDLLEEWERPVRKMDLVRIAVLSAELEVSISVVVDATRCFSLFLAVDVVADISSE